MAVVKKIKLPNNTTYDIGAYTNNLQRPSALNGVSDPTIQTLISTARANRFAFLPASQIIIEKTVDGGATWTDAGVSDAVKAGLFAETRASISIPLIDGKRNLNCGLRVTFTAMRYDVPSGTSELQKYNYWSSDHVLSTERYCSLQEMYFWVSSATDSIGVKVEGAMGSSHTTWSTLFNDTSYGMTGWSGPDYIRFSPSVFGGGTTQTTNRYWNWRITFMTRGPNGSSSELSPSSQTSAQVISEIRGYGVSVWTAPNQYMNSDKLYSVDYNKNATFPANVVAQLFSGSGASLTSLNGSNISSGTVAAARIADLAASKITSGTFDVARIPNLAASKITTGTIDTARLPAVSTTAAGIMSASDKTKLDGLENPTAITNAEIDAITG